MSGIDLCVSDKLFAEEDRRPDREKKRPVTVYEGSVSMDMLVENGGDSPRLECLYENLTIDGSLITRIHPNLRKDRECHCTPAEDDESSFTDVVISRGGTSVRFGELEYMTAKGRALVSRGGSVRFEEAIGEGLGVHYSFKDSSSVQVYTEADYLHAHRETKGVVVFAPNFVYPQEEGSFAPVTDLDAPGHIKISATGHGDLRDMHVKGSLTVNKIVVLHAHVVPPIGGWYFDERRRGEWYRPPGWMVVPEKQKELGVAEDGDLVISRGNASVLIRKDGSVTARGLVAVLASPVSYGEGERVSVDARGLSDNGVVLSYRTIVVFQ